MIGADLLVSFSKTFLSIFNWFLLYYYSNGTDLIALILNRQICWRILRHWTFGTLYTHMFFMLACFCRYSSKLSLHIMFFLCISSGHQESGKGTSIECSAPSPPHGGTCEALELHFTCVRKSKRAMPHRPSIC